jgi:hypothetical protein
LLPEFDGEVRVILLVTIIGIVGYLAFLMAEYGPLVAPDVRFRWSAFAQRAFSSRSSTLNFTAALSQTTVAGNYGRGCRLKFREKREASDMKKAVLALATAATIGVTALAAPSPAQAWRGGWGPGLAGGLIAGAVIGGIASSAYAYGPGYGYYGGPAYGYYGGYAPAYYGGYAPAYYNYGYAPAYYGGYRSSYYAPAYYGPRYRRVIRRAYW